MFIADSSSDFLEVQSRSYVLQTLSSHSRPVALMASEARYTSKGTTVGTGGMLESMLSFPLAYRLKTCLQHLEAGQPLAWEGLFEA